MSAQEVITLLLVVVIIVGDYLMNKKSRKLINVLFNQLGVELRTRMETIESSARNLVASIYFTDKFGKSDAGLPFRLAMDLLTFHAKVAIDKTVSTYQKGLELGGKLKPGIADAATTLIVSNKDYIDMLAYAIKVSSLHSDLTMIRLSYSDHKTGQHVVTDKWKFNKNTDIEFILRTVRRFIKKWVEVKLQEKMTGIENDAYIEVILHITLESVKNNSYGRVGIFSRIMDFWENHPDRTDDNPLKKDFESEVFYRVQVLRDDFVQETVNLTKLSEMNNYKGGQKNDKSQ